MPLPFSKPPPDSKTYPLSFPVLCFEWQEDKSTTSFLYLYTTILLPAANKNPTPDRPVVCCHLKLVHIQLFLGVNRSLMTLCEIPRACVFFLQRNFLNSVKLGGNQEMMRGVHESLVGAIFRHLPVCFGYISRR